MSIAADKFARQLYETGLQYEYKSSFSSLTPWLSSRHQGNEKGTKEDETLDSVFLLDIKNGRSTSCLQQEEQ